MQENFPAKTRRGLHDEGEMVAGIKDPHLAHDFELFWDTHYTHPVPAGGITQQDKSLSNSLLISGVLRTLLSKLRSF